MQAIQRDHLIPAKTSEPFARVFAWYTRRLLRKRFEGVHLTRSSVAALGEIDLDARPLVLLLNHSSWWDPLVAFYLSRTLLPSRSGIAPMDRDQLERFGFFRRIGVFGIAPDAPASMHAMVRYSTSVLSARPFASLLLTPQGRFTDVRAPLELRPGAAAVCAALAAGQVHAACLSIEYGFWQSQRPHVFMHVQRITPPEYHSVAGWQRVLTASMQQSMATLATQVIGRNTDGFADLLARQGSSVHPVFDFLLKMRRQSGEISATRTPTPKSST